ncbi:hypothetical protein [Bordetella bronchiseptica]|uniref:hypothetical protein n=1 Tax=Bordetella bronchiseptica TaxID=518 RepID=UPI00052845B5|nr:hypothetical protein [Bordetella bronchiseptica]
MDKRAEREQRMYDTLKRIARGYCTPDQMRRSEKARCGLDYEEALGYAYENIQREAAQAIKGMRRPAAQPTTSAKGPAHGR